MSGFRECFSAEVYRVAVRSFTDLEGGKMLRDTIAKGVRGLESHLTLRIKRQSHAVSRVRPSWNGTVLPNPRQDK
jgi:hypothetical protein